MSDTPGPRETIKGKRRRQGASSGPQSGERAEMPGRQRPGGSGTRPPTGGGGPRPSTGGSGLGGSAPRLPIWLVLLLIAGYFIFNLFFGGDSGEPVDSDQPVGQVPAADQNAEPPEPIIQPTARPQATRPAPAAGATSGQTWTVMLYQDADDRILEQDIYLDLNEAERVGSTDRVRIVAQVDRYRGAYSGDRDWTSTRRYFVTQDDDLQRVNSELVEDLGELNMADGETLSDFIVWAAETYPADRYVLILSDHGMGWPGGFSDTDPAARDASNAPLASALGDDQLYMMELEDTLAESLQRANIDKLEIVGMDACLMGHLEVLSALEPYARYAVLSQETEPALGWAYTSFFQSLVEDPDMSGAELSERIVTSYIKDDLRINDDQARAEFLRQGSPFGGLFGSANQMSATALARQLEREITLTAVDLSGIPALVQSLNDLAFNLQNENQEAIASARTYAPSFTNIFGRDAPSPYIDLGGFVQMLQRQGLGAESSRAADQVLADLQAAIVAERHGPGKPGASGISIYFPNSTLYRSPYAGPQSYTVMARRFSEVSLWDDFLRFFYSDVSFSAQPAAPSAQQPGAISRAPGQGEIEVTPIELSSSTAAPNNPVTLSTQVTGQNIGYIYLLVGFYDQTGNAIFQADADYIESPNTRELNGVYYPEWSASGSFNLEIEWEPTLFQITDGETSAVALLTPETYGTSAEEAVYTVDGVYNYADGTSRSARMYFRDGVMRQVFGFTDDNQTGAVREIIPEAGDSFTIIERWLDLDDSGQVVQASTQEGATLTFGDQPFEWEEVFAAPGEYVIGLIVEDLDGNRQEVYTTVTVQ